MGAYKRVLLWGLLCFSSVAQAQTSHKAELMVPIIEATQVVTPAAVPAISVYKVTNESESSNIVRTSGLPIQNVTVDPDFVYRPLSGGPAILSCRYLDGWRTLAPHESCVIKFNISGAVPNQPFRVQLGTLVGTVDINVTTFSNPTQSLSVTPNFINLSPGRTADLFVTNPSAGFVANNVKAVLPAPIAERVAKVSYSGCDWLATGSVCKVTLLAKTDITVPAVGWLRVAASNTRTQTVPIQIGASG
jgi:hypothetical protein